MTVAARTNIDEKKVLPPSHIMSQGFQLTPESLVATPEIHKFDGPTTTSGSLVTAKDPMPSPHSPSPQGPPLWLEPRVPGISPPSSASHTLFSPTSNEAKINYEHNNEVNASRPQLENRQVNASEHFYQLPLSNERQSDSNAPLIPAHHGGSYIGSTTLDADTQNCQQRFPQSIDETNMIMQIRTYGFKWQWKPEAIAQALNRVGYPDLTAEIVQKYLDWYKDNPFWGRTGALVPRLEDLHRL